MQVQNFNFSQTHQTPLPQLDMSRSARSERYSSRSPRRDFSQTSPPSPSKSARSPRLEMQKKRINPVLSMSQRICPEIQRVSVNFAQLSVLMRNFLTENSIPTLNPNLPNVFSTLSLAYDTYCHQCTLMFSNVTRSPSQRNFHQGSPIFVQGKLLMTKWVDFIEKINEIVDVDVEPYRNKIHQYIQEYKSVMKRAITHARKTQYYPKPVVAILKKMCQRADRCEMKTLDIFDSKDAGNLNENQVNPVHHNSEENLNANKNTNENENSNENENTNENENNDQNENVDENVNGNGFNRDGYEAFSAYEQQTAFFHLLDATTKLFEQTLPKDMMPIREMIRLKTRSINACAMILEVLNAIDAFHMSISKIKGQIVNVNSELNHVHQLLNLPFSVTLTMNGKKLGTSVQ